MRDFWPPRDDELWRAAVSLQAESLNTFTAPLSFSEVAGMARTAVWRDTFGGTIPRLRSGRCRRHGGGSVESPLVSHEAIQVTVPKVVRATHSWRG